MKAFLISLAVTVAIGIAGSLPFVLRSAPAAPVDDPWATGEMRVLGSLNTPTGEHVTAIYVPSWPLSTMCLIVSAPAGLAIRCDNDMPAEGPK